LLGADANGNGVRDDVEAYITQRYTDAHQHAVMMNYAGAATAFLLATDPAGALAAVVGVDQAAICGYNTFGLAAFRVERTAVQSAVLNNMTRLQAYFANDQRLDGAELPSADTLTCSIDGAPYNGAP
jgi:hypothetical protein